MLREHSKKNHHVCDRIECTHLAFEDSVQLSEHYLRIHNQVREAKVEFGFQMHDDEDDEYSVGYVRRNADK